MTSLFQPLLGFLGDIGAGEILIILAAVLILFGGKGLPPIARKLGRMTHELQKATQEFKKQILTADQQPPPEPPPHPPLPPEKDADKP